MDPIQLLKERGELSSEVLQKASQLFDEGNGSYEDALLGAGVDKHKARSVLAEYYQVPVYEIPEGFSVKQDILNYLPQESSSHYMAVPVGIEDGVLLIGASNPDDLRMREALNFIGSKYNIPFRLLFMLKEDVATVQQFYENLEGEVVGALENIETELGTAIEESTDESFEKVKQEASNHIEDDGPIIKIVATILRYAVDGKASDIHIEPSRTKVGVRFRVDGDLQKSLELPKNIHNSIIARVKLMSGMRLDEKRKPQDGRFSAPFDGRKIDFRVSLLPTSNGEKIVMRILDNDKGVRSLEETGITKENIDIIKRMINEPYGIILISGPTGSGKSTTLYGMLAELDRATNNVLSLEDPVEYSIEGVSQSQVKPEIGYTFAAGLRAALRQDPDIIMVGEIRDKETAQLAIQAALTGHLVLSTIHTNNAIGVIPRLIDMGVDPYLIAPTLKLAIAQRLARTLCAGTGTEREVDKSTRTMIEESFKTLPKKFHSRIPEIKTIMDPQPTPQCSTGLRGRTAVTEVLEVSEEIQELILRNASEEEFIQAARKNGYVTLHEDAIIKALKHEIPYEEMNVFRSKITSEMLPEEESAPMPVDNPFENYILEDIIDSNETTTR